MKQIVALLLAFVAVVHGAQELRFCLHSEPRTFNPILVDEESGETIRYLTAGVLLRVNRLTQEIEPELATSYKVLEGGRAISFRLREGVSFSDGTPFSAADVAYTFRLLMDPATHSPTADAFRSSEGKVESMVEGRSRITVRFPAPVAGLDKLFDQVGILSAASPKKELAVLGPYRIKEHKAGASIALERNPNYWKRDAEGRKLPYIDSIRLDIEQNREVELLRYQRGELDLINTVDADFFDRLAAKSTSLVVDAGPGMDAEFLWFNQAPGSPIAAHKKAWFRSTAFRRAISGAINRQDICRLAFKGHATPAFGPVSPGNKLWFNAALKPALYQPDAALRSLEKEGFRLSGGVLRDREGREVQFSLITNAGNKARVRIAAMVQQDLEKIGIKVTVTGLDFPSVLERMNRTLDYDACLLGLVNVDLDPNLQMSVWLSSSAMHAWNPKQPKPETAWEAEIDSLMRTQASQLDFKKRKAAFDRVQQLAAEQQPILYLVNKNVLSAISPGVRNARPVILRPQAFWNIERLTVKETPSRKEAAAR